MLQYQSMMLVERAAEKPTVLKLSSVAVHSARPAMMGKRDKFTHRPAGRRREGGANTYSKVLLYVQRHNEATVFSAL